MFRIWLKILVEVKFQDNKKKFLNFSSADRWQKFVAPHNIFQKAQDVATALTKNVQKTWF